MYSGSALVDLKAELSRKEEEFGKLRTGQEKAKQGSSNKTFQKLHAITKSKKKTKKKRVGEWRGSDEDEGSKGKEISDEMQEAYLKSQQKMLAKAKIYDKMQKGEMEDVQDFKGETRFLVDFEQKYIENDTRTLAGPSSQNDDSVNRGSLKFNNLDGALSNEDEVERTLSQADLEKDEARRQRVSEDIYEADLEYRDKLHEKWQKEQDDLLNGPLHYENVKFDEVRNMGTSYFAFSKNEEERQKQMEGLRKMREETESVRKKKEMLQTKRKAALDARLEKVKRRKAEEEGRLDDYLKELVSKTTEAKAETDKPADDVEEKSNDSVSTETDDFIKELRKQSAVKTRDWDKGKESNFVGQAFVKSGVPPQTGLNANAGRPSTATSTTSTSKPRLESSYEKRIENVRKERPDEFAPPGFY